MPEFPDIIGGAGLALAVVTFALGFIRHRENTKGGDNRYKEAMKALVGRRQDAAKRHVQAMTARQALIRNTAPPLASPAE